MVQTLGKHNTNDLLIQNLNLISQYPRNMTITLIQGVGNEKQFWIGVSLTLQAKQVQQSGLARSISELEGVTRICHSLIDLKDFSATDLGENDKY